MADPAEKIRSLTLVSSSSAGIHLGETAIAGFTDVESPRIQWKIWIGVLILTLILHLIFFLTKVDWLTAKPAPPIEVQQVDPRKLEAIKKAWANQEKRLLIDKDHAKSNVAEAPKDARYMSDRNFHVDKEQRARDTTVIPAPGSVSQTNEQQQQQKAQAKSEPQTKSAHALPKLGNLGVPFHLDQTAKPKQDEQQEKPFQAPSRPGGEQYVDDKNLPLGSENLLNSEESVYYSFYARLYDAIGPIWASKLREIAPGVRVNPGDYTTSVDVVLDKEGNLQDVRLMQSSGVREFDQTVNDSWRRIGRFPNPPSGLLGKDGLVHTGWNFTVQFGGNSGLNFMPPQRTY